MVRQPFSKCSGESGQGQYSVQDHRYLFDGRLVEGDCYA